MSDPTRTFDRLLKLLIGSVRPAPGRRLPLGRCACHEPTVKWCGRHGQPIKQPA